MCFEQRLNQYVIVVWRSVDQCAEADIDMFLSQRGDLLRRVHLVALYRDVRI